MCAYFNMLRNHNMYDKSFPLLIKIKYSQPYIGHCHKSIKSERNNDKLKKINACILYSRGPSLIFNYTYPPLISTRA